MSDQLKYLENVYKQVKELQNSNAEFRARVMEAKQQYPEMEIDHVITSTFSIDGILTQELEEIGEAYERTKATLEAAQSDQKDSPAAPEDSFNSFINDCIAQFEARDDLMDSGDSFWLDFHKEGRNGTRSVSVIIKEER